MDPESFLTKQCKKKIFSTKKKWFFKILDCKILSLFPYPKLIELKTPQKKYSQNNLLFPRLLRFTTYFRKDKGEFFKKNKKSLKKSIPIYMKLNLNIKIKKLFIPFFPFFKKKFSQLTFFPKISKKEKRTLIFGFFDSLALFSPLENFFFDKFFIKKKNLEKNLFFLIKSQEYNLDFTKRKNFKNIFDIKEKGKIPNQKNKLMVKNKEFFKNSKENFVLRFSLFSLNFEKKYPKHFKLKISKKVSHFISYDSLLTNEKLVFFGEKKKLNSLTVKQISDKKIGLLTCKFLPKRIIFFNLFVNKILNLYEFSQHFFKNFSIKFFEKTLEIFLVEEKEISKFSQKRGFLCFRRCSVKFLLNKKIKKRYNPISFKKRNLGFFFLKEKLQNYLVFDRDFFFGFIIDFRIKKLSLIKSIAGFLKFEKLKDKNIKMKEKESNEIEPNLWINFLLLKDLLIMFFLKERQKFFFIEINNPLSNPEALIPEPILLPELRYLKKQIEEGITVIPEIKNFFYFEAMLQELWKNEIKIFFWDFPKIKLWNIRRSKSFQKIFFKWYMKSILLERKILKQNNPKKKKGEIFFDFKKWTLKRKNKKLLGKKIIQKKLMEFKKNVKFLKKYKKKRPKYFEEIFQKNLKFLRLKEKLFKNFYFSDFVFSIQKKINHMDHFLFKNKKKFVQSSNCKSQNSLFKKLYLENQNFSREQKINFRVGFSIFSTLNPWIVFLNYGVVFCFISKKNENSFLKLNFGKERKKNILLKIFMFFRLKGTELLTLCNFYRPFEQYFQKFSPFPIKKMIRKIIFFAKKLIFFKKKKFTNQKEEFFFFFITKNIKENFSMENFLYFFKNESLTSFLFYKNFFKNKIDFDFKSVFLKKIVC
ncbi:hypothetical protein HAN_2g199 (nucleomorph) [Hemiselmis andersenii]|uniref:Uncharacterized protein n=3 Tax=Hemiselmis andersenii TaxID=464988 RepID=A9BKM2_HEMAN|nr:hypothetical protein HAN_2g199 [Hemiselmis andersenii]ABW98027.1 hypothetical protein HAN_2g199 [Hemiselmis andersenii]